MQYFKLADIKKLENNPRTISKEDMDRLKESIKKYGIIEWRPFIVSNRTGENIIIAGNMRYEACKSLGIIDVPVHIMEWLTEEDEKEITIRDNVNNGKWDFDMLANLWDSTELKDWGVDMPEIVPDDTIAVDDAYVIPDDIETDIVPDDIFTISTTRWLTHMLICGSSTDPNTFTGIQKADMMFSDPPYLMNFQGGMAGDGSKNNRHKVIKNDNLNKKEWDQFLRDFLSLVPTICKGSWYISFYRLGIDRLFSALTDTDLKWRNLIIWKKNHKNLSNSDYQSIYEPIFYWFADDYIPIVYGWTEEHQFFGWKWKQDDVWDDIPLPSVWEINRTKKNDLHPTMKPVELVGRCIRNSSKPWETVLDMFLGSGTTLVACHQMGRNCVGVELDPMYCAVILDRMYKLDPTVSIFRNGVPYEIKIR